MKPLSIVLVAVALVVGLAAGYFWGQSVGKQQAQADIEALQEQLAQAAADEAVKATNLFQQVNPLEGVEANPFDDAQKALNPFE